MSINTQKSRERIKRSTLTGVVPTVPVSSDFTDGTWLNTDIRAGEFFYNIPDEKLWIGTNTVPLELTSGIGNTLADILLNGNTTSGSDIIITSSDLIKDSTGQTYIDINATSLQIKSDDNVNNREAVFTAVNDFGSDTLSVAMSAFDATNNIYTSFGLTADSLTPIIHTHLSDTILTTFNQFTIGRHYTEVTNSAGSPSNPATDIFAAVDIINNPAIQTTIGLTTCNIINNSFASITLDADAASPSIISHLNNGSFNNWNTLGATKNSSIITDGSSSSPNPATDTYSIIDLFGIDINKPNILLQTVRPGNYNHRISLADTGMIISSDINIKMNGQSVEINTLSFLDLTGMYNGLTANILRTADNFAAPITSTANQTPGIIIGSQYSTIAAGVYNSLIIGGNNNTIFSNNTIISGTNNTANANATHNIISGNGNTINSSHNLIVGSGNTITGIGIPYSYNIIGGYTNTVNTFSSLCIGVQKTMNNQGIMYGFNVNTQVSNGFSNMSNVSTNATPTKLYCDGLNSFKVENNVVYRVKLTALAVDSTTGDAKEWEGFGIIKNVGGTTSLVSAITMTSTVGDAGLAAATVAVTANNTTDALDITVTGIAATSIKWNCGIEYVKVG